jgi:hypothetical protein
VGVTNPSIIINDLLRHVLFAEIGEKLITDDGVHGFETFAGGRLLVLRTGGGWDCGKMGNDGSGGCSDGSHCGGEKRPCFPVNK